MSFIEHAKREFKAIGYKENEEGPNKWIQENVLELLEVFSKQGHSGSSAPFCINYFKKLANYEPLSPITCESSEWGEVDGETFQNNRLSSVFKNGENGYPYYIDAIVFRGNNGSCFTGSATLKDGTVIESRQFIKLPFTPKTFYVDVIETEWADKEEKVKKEGGGWWTSVIKDKNQLKEIFEYYQINIK